MNPPSFHLPAPTLEWLLDESDPGGRYLALRDLFDFPADHPRLAAARALAHIHGPIAAYLQGMHPDGYWVEPGAGYYPKYTGSVWAILTLAQLGASCAMDARIETGCAYLLQHALTAYGQFSASGGAGGTADCLQGNLCAALLDLGVAPERLASAFDWMARSVTGEGIAPASDKSAPVRYYAGKCGPRFACGSNDRRSCAWGAVKVALALSKWPRPQRTPRIERAIQATIEFLLGVDPATAAYPSGYAARPSGNWWKFGFPVYYVSDLLQIVEALAGLGAGEDARLGNAIALTLSKQDAGGRWLLEYDYTGKTWVNFGPKKQPNRWVTLRVLRVLRALGILQPQKLAATA